MPYSPAPSCSNGWIGTDERSGAMTISSCGMLRASVISATTNRAMRASSDTVSCNIAARRLVEIKQHRQVIALTQLLPQGIEHRFTLCRKAAEDQHHLRGDRVD